MNDDTPNLTPNLSPDLEFGKQAAESSKDNFMVWLIENLEPLGVRFDWSDEELDAIADLLMAARDNAIDDFGQAIDDVGKLA